MIYKFVDVYKNFKTIQWKNLYNFPLVKDQKKNEFIVSKYMIPHPDKKFKGGEDAFFANSQLLSVADGVGGWAQHGVDPGIYSKKFCKNIGELYEKDIVKYQKNPKNLIIDSHKITKEIGSTTACLATIDDNMPIIYTSYIGDSGYMIFRLENNDFQTVYVSQEQQKSFNFPYQIGSEGDSPSKSLEYQHEIKNNDIIVLGTDGLLDNLDTNQIIKCLKPFFLQSKNPIENNRNKDAIGETLAQFAYKLSLDPIYNSPFARKAKEHYYDFNGGKSDDITVIVAQIQLRDSI